MHCKPTVNGLWRKVQEWRRECLESDRQLSKQRVSRFLLSLVTLTFPWYVWIKVDTDETTCKNLPSTVHYYMRYVNTVYALISNSKMRYCYCCLKERCDLSCGSSTVHLPWFIWHTYLTKRLEVQMFEKNQHDGNSWVWNTVHTSNVGLNDVITLPPAARKWKYWPNSTFRSSFTHQVNVQRLQYLGFWLKSL